MIDLYKMLKISFEGSKCKSASKVVLKMRLNFHSPVIFPTLNKLFIP